VNLKVERIWSITSGLEGASGPLDIVTAYLLSGDITWFVSVIDSLGLSRISIVKLVR